MLENLPLDLNSMRAPCASTKMITVNALKNATNLGRERTAPYDPKEERHRLQHRSSCWSNNCRHERLTEVQRWSSSPSTRSEYIHATDQNAFRMPQS